MATASISMPRSFIALCSTGFMAGRPARFSSLLLVIPITPNLSSMKLHWCECDQSIPPPSLLLHHDLDLVVRFHQGLTSGQQEHIIDKPHCRLPLFFISYLQQVH